MFIKHPTFAFYIIHFGSESNTFGDLGKSFLKVFVMIHGEFEFEALWKDSADRLEKKPLVKVFTMLLLVGLCLSGSLIMVKEKVNLQTFPFPVEPDRCGDHHRHLAAAPGGQGPGFGEPGRKVLTKLQEFRFFFACFLISTPTRVCCKYSNGTMM